MTTTFTLGNEPHIMIYTDGACIGNPGPGGYGAILISVHGGAENKRKLVSGGDKHTTNNRMEMQAAIAALEAFKNRSKPIVIRSDSQLLIRGMNEWVGGWEHRGWRKSDRKPVENIDLWQRLQKLAAVMSITWEWVRGHAGDPFNELADSLANKAAHQFAQ